METIVSNREKLLQMYNYAISNGICSNRKTFAGVIGIGDKNLSNALSNNEKTADRFCTNGLLNKANAALGYVFSQQWIQDGTGDMYAHTQATTTAEIPTKVTPSTTAAEDKPKISQSNDKIIGHLEYTIEVQKKLIEKLEKENDALKKANTYASASVKHA